eukprot:TRINITY_DN17746_c0_g1_i1.p1 TRINITY_DN17746_c0_g1~~TRINITY_DN17746_c0_g1_i1.p1  ORF type:complete len:1173 (+),score=111.84 TRINITY_DN17746_c0_g1_i1:244-3519(+)
MLEVDCSIVTTPGTSRTLCNCSSSRFGSEVGLHWIVITGVVNKSLAAQPGEWFITDKSAKCVAATPENHPKPLPCPIGFYCLGGNEPPRSCDTGDFCPVGTAASRSCPEGFFCRMPSSPKLPCPDGTVCKAGRSWPSLCSVSYYCHSGHSILCKAGHYCPEATSNPLICPPFTHCPEGSKSPDRTIWCVLLLVGGLVITILGGRFYTSLAQSGIAVMVVCIVAILPLFFIDEVLAFFISLKFVVIAANWVLLRIATCPWYLTRVLLNLSGLAALVAVWLVNPAWVLVFAGMVVLSMLGWLMWSSHQSLMWLGRLLLCGAFVCLSLAYIAVDPLFMVVIGVSLALIMLSHFASWVVDHRGQGRQPPADLRFASLGTVRNVGDEVPSEVSLQPTVSTALPVSSPPLPASDTASVARRLSSAPRGVSFSLEDMNFDLPDGSRLLSGITLHINSGQRVAVMGASGSGKSTLLAAMSGRASYGRVTGHMRVGGHPADDLSFLSAVTGFVPQDDVVHGELTVIENIRFQALLRLSDTVTRAYIEEWLETLLSQLNLSDIKNCRVGTPEKRGVSGGQRKRVSIGMELVTQPSLLFADEPTSGLDSTTSFEVVSCLNKSAANINSTVVAVIHQPRYDTLLLFDALIVLVPGGRLCYVGSTGDFVDYFADHMHIEFPPNSNPADVLLDELHPDPLLFAEGWGKWTKTHNNCFDDHQLQRKHMFRRNQSPFFRSVLILSDRCMLQTIRAWPRILVNSILVLGAVFVAAQALTYNKLDEFIQQSAYTAMILMLVQGVGSQFMFSADFPSTWREAQTGISMAAYFIAKDIVGFIHVTIAAIVFTAGHSMVSGILQSISSVFRGAWAFVYCVVGLGYLMCLAVPSDVVAKMAFVGFTFVSVLFSGNHPPFIPHTLEVCQGRGWVILALNPIRWLLGFLITHEVQWLSPVSKIMSHNHLARLGYDIDKMGDCLNSTLGFTDNSVLSMKQAWGEGRGWVCSVSEMLLLGMLFRFMATLCLFVRVNYQTSGWGRFLGASNRGVWRLRSRLFLTLVATFLLMFLLAEIWLFGILRLDWEGWLPKRFGDTEKHIPGKTNTLLTENFLTA